MLKFLGSWLKRNPRVLRSSHRPSWKNWLGNLKAYPEQLVEPSSLKEVQDAVRLAREQGWVVRPCGTGHAWTPQVPTDGMIIKTSKLRSLLAIEGDIIHVEAGMTLREMVRHAKGVGLSVQGSPIFSDISVGGIAATGSHGTGMVAGCFSDYVVGMTLVLGDGGILEIDESEPELLRAARVNLGVLGFVYSLKIKCLPAIKMHTRQISMPIQEGLDRLMEFAYEHRHASVFWFPFTDKFFANISNPTDKKQTFHKRHRWL